MLFSEIIGQHEIKTRFVRTVFENRIPHAQLFRGLEGIGKLGLAIAYAQFISCENRSATDACGKCPSCVKYKKLAHPDLHFVFPIIKPPNKTSAVCDDFVADFRAMILHNPYFGINDWYSKISGDAKQGLIYSNESEEILRKLNLKTYESEYKIMIIWLPEKMHNTCANKLLKILEEPPEKTLFFLVSNAPDQIITTILSRTQHVNIPRLDENEIEKALLQNTDLELEQYAANYAAHVANGSYLAALNVLSAGDENKENFERFTMIMRKAWQVGNQKNHAALKDLRKWADDMAAATVGRERQKNFLVYSQRMTRENFIWNIKQPALNNLTNFETDFSQKFSPFINERNVELIMTEFALAERHIEQNVNAKMVFFDLTLKMIMLLKK
jgi:DNA polymerase-3 subunit delta'